jgi:hypothetical protein
MKTSDIRIGECYAAERQLRDFSKICGIPYRDWPVVIVDKGRPYQVKSRYNWATGESEPRFRNVGVLVRDVETNIEYEIESRHVLATWADHTAALAERVEYEAERDAYKASRDQRDADISLALRGALEKARVDLGSLGDLGTQIERGDSSLYVDTEDLLSLVRALGLTDANIGPKIEPPLTPAQRRATPPQEYATEAGRARQQERFLQALTTLAREQDRRDEENERGLITPTHEADGTEIEGGGQPSPLGNVPAHLDAGEDEFGEPVRQLKIGLSRWIATDMLAYYIAEEHSMSESMARRTLTELGRRGLAWCSYGEMGGWRISDSGRAMLDAASVQTPDFVPVTF